MIQNIREINAIWKNKNRINVLKGKKTLSQIADSMNMNVSAINKILGGSVGVYLHRLVQISEILDCQVSDLLPPEWSSAKTFSINKDDVADFTVLLDILDEVEKEKNAKISNEAKARTLIALYMQLKNRNDNDNKDLEDIVNYASIYMDAVINQ